MKKYILFWWSDYYPMGGLNDVLDSFDTLDEVKHRIGTEDRYNNFEIVDRDTWEIIR